MTSQHSKLTISRLAIIATAVVTVACSISASAQVTRGEDDRRPGPRGGVNLRDGGTSMQRVLQPDFHARDMAILSRRLELDHSQRPIFEMLLEDYREAFRDAAHPLEHALRHWQLHQMEQRMEQRRDRLRSDATTDGSFEHSPQITATAIESAIDAGGAAISFARIEGNRVIVAHHSGNEFQSQHPVDRISNSNQAGLSEENTQQQPTDREETPRQVRADISPEMQERIERVRDRIQRRMEERLERQREEMRLRGIDPDEEVVVRQPSEIADMAKSLLVEKEQLRNRFESDARVLLAPRQRENLPETLRMLRRLNGLQDSRLSGEQIDLMMVLEDLRLLPAYDVELEEILLAYSGTLDDALTKRVRALERLGIDRFIASHEGDINGLISLTDQEMQLRIAVRSLNDRYTELIADALSEDDRELFEDAVFARAFPQVAGSTPIEQAIPALLEETSITDEQREKLQQLQIVHADSLAEHRRKTAESMRKREVEYPREALEFSQRIRELRASGQDMREVDWSTMQPPLPVQYLTRYVHHHLDLPFLDQLRGIVSDAQLQELLDDNESLRRVARMIESIEIYGGYDYSAERPFRWRQREQ